MKNNSVTVNAKGEFDHIVPHSKWLEKNNEYRITQSEAMARPRYTYAHSTGSYNGAELRHRSMVQR